MKESNSGNGSGGRDGRMDPSGRSAPSEGRGSDPIAAWIDARLEAYVDDELPPEERRRLDAYVSADEAWAEQLRLAQAVRAALSTIESPSCPPELAQSVLSRVRAESPREFVSTARDRGAVRRPKPAGVVRARLDEIWAVFVRPALAVTLFAALVVSAALVGRPGGEPASIADARPPSSESIADPAPANTDAVVSADPPSNTDATPANGEAPPTNADASPRNAQDAPTTSSTATARGPAAPARAGDVPDPDVDRALQEAKWALAFVSDVSREAGESLRRSVLQERVAEPIRRALGAALDGGSTS